MAGHTIKELHNLIGQQTTLAGSVVALMDNLKAKVDAAQGDQAEIDAAFDEVTANAASLGDALVRDTPADTPQLKAARAAGQAPGAQGAGPAGIPQTKR